MTPKPSEAPPAPDQAGSYKTGINVYLDSLNRMLDREMRSRTKYDPQRIQEQQGLQEQFGPTQYRQMLDALKAIDPTGYNLREQTGASIAGDLAAGTSLTKDQSTDLEQQIRRSQSSRGNVYGQAPVQAEAFTKGTAGLQLYQQRLANSMQFQNSATPESWLQMIPPVMPDRSSAYVDPNAGFQGQQFALQNYQNQLAASGMQGGQTNPWMSALGGASTGAGYGSAFGPYGAVGGAVVGGVLGGATGNTAFSDKRLKRDIKPVGKVKGIQIYEHAYKFKPGRFIGAIAQDVKRTRPDAVERDPDSGLLKVNYGKLGLPMPQQIGGN